MGGNLRVWVAAAGALIMTAGLIAACGGGGGTAEPGTTPDATATALQEDVEGQAVTPVPASEIGRDDCPEGWLGYQHTNFNLCYPSEYLAQELKVPDRPNDRFLSVRLVAEDRSAFNPNAMSVTFSDEYKPPSKCEFGIPQMDENAKSEIAPYDAGGLSGMACTVSNDLATEFKGMLETSNGGIEFNAFVSKDDQLDLAKQILATVQPA